MLLGWIPSALVWLLPLCSGVNCRAAERTGAKELVDWNGDLCNSVVISCCDIVILFFNSIMPTFGEGVFGSLLWDGLSGYEEFGTVADVGLTWALTGGSVGRRLSKV
jgi:hypothetical protein